jgi:3-oxoacyl-[acyl-carrier protein] reductase
MCAGLASKVAIVTGGSRGIGLAVARALLDDGAAVAVAGTRDEPLERAARALGHDRLLTVKADVRDHAQAFRVVEATVERFGGLDILVNNAGVGGFSNVADMTLDTWRSIIDTNLSGVFFCSRAAIPHLRLGGGGWIINISSLAAENPFVGGAAYCASKAGLNAFTEALMLEVRHDGIRVATVMPGSVRTEFSPGGDAEGTDWKLAPEDVAQVVLDLVHHHPRSLPSRVEIRPSRPRRA